MFDDGLFCFFYFGSNNFPVLSEPFVWLITPIVELALAAGLDLDLFC
jgi:hypothetical protein